MKLTLFLFTYYNLLYLGFQISQFIEGLFAVYSSWSTFLPPRCPNLQNFYLLKVSQPTWFYFQYIVVGAPFVSQGVPTYILPASLLVEFQLVHFYSYRASRIVIPTFTPVMDGHTLVLLAVRSVWLHQYTLHITLTLVHQYSSMQRLPVMFLKQGNQCHG